MLLAAEEKFLFFPIMLWNITNEKIVMRNYKGVLCEYPEK